MKLFNTPTWDIFCKVIDNWGDAGVCWRLAQGLQARGLQVRLWIDDPKPLAWMAFETAPNQLPPVEIIHWQDPLPPSTPGEAFIEAFGCRAPDSFLQAVASQEKPAVWINLEYLSAQKYAQELHGLPSLQQFGPAKGLTRWFYHPGFTSQTGGLLRELDLKERQKKFNRQTWLQQLGIVPAEDALLISLFSYPNPALPALLKQWEEHPTPIHLLATPGHTTQQIGAHYGLEPAPYAITQQGSLKISFLPYLNQQDFDHLLWSCDLNMVRGEDSWIRAIWANRPFIWQPYIQEDGEHLNKLEAFNALIPTAPAQWQLFQQQWSQQIPPNWRELFAILPEVAKAQQALFQQLETHPDLCSSLIDFVANKREG